jgi:uncharacterized glyoxalase superfamily protein PhnB
MATVLPRMFVDDPAGAVRFLRDVFGAVGEFEAERPTQLAIGDSTVLVSGTVERARFPAFLYIYVDDTDAAFARAVEAGAEVLEAPLQTPYGQRRAMVRDPHGNVFQIATA